MVIDSRLVVKTMPIRPYVPTENPWDDISLDKVIITQQRANHSPF
jgi:hypothetical protein